MADNLDPDLQAKRDFFKSQEDEMKEGSLSVSAPETLKDMKAPELIALQHSRDGDFQMGSIRALIGQMEPGETVLKYDEANREYDQRYHDRVAGGSHREFEAQFTAVVNQTGVDRVDFIFNHLPTFGRFSTERGATHEVKSEIISAGLDAALEAEGVPEHLWPTYKHELNEMRARSQAESQRGVMFGTREGEVSVAPGVRSAWHYDVNGRK